MANSDKKLRISVNHREGIGELEDRYYCNLRVGGVRLSYWYPTYEDAVAAATIVAVAVRADGFWVMNGTPKPVFVKI